MTAVVETTNIDPTFAANFTSGEKGLSVGTGSIAAPQTICMAKRIALPVGAYRLKIVADDAATVWLGSGYNAMRLIASTAVPTSLQIFEFEVTAGETRLDIYLQTLGSTAGRGYAQFTIYRPTGALAYASAAAGWQWQYNSPLPDASLTALPDQRRNLPVFTLQPNWSDGVLERLEWLTDVLTSQMNLEQRRALRTFPRRSFETGFLRQRQQRAYLDNFFTGIGKREFLLPLWHEQFRVPVVQTTASSGVTFPAGTLALREFRAGDLVLLNDGNPDEFDVAIIASINLATDRISWEVGPSRTWPALTRITPLRRAKLMELPTLSNASDRVATVQLRFDLMEGQEPFEPSWNYCAPLWRLKPNWGEGISTTYDRLDFTLDNEIAQPYTVDPSDQTSYGEQAGFTLRHRAEVVAYRQFLAMARGRQVRFYFPSFLDDLTPVGNIAGPFLRVKQCGLVQSMHTRQFARRMIGIDFNDDNPTIYRAVAQVVTEGGGNELVYLDSDLPAITPSRVKRISWILPARFDQDSFEIKHLTDDSNVVTTAVVVRAVDNAEMPPIECWTTSLTYPVVVTEHVNTSAVITVGRLYDNTIKNDDLINVVASIRTASLIEIPYTLIELIDALNTSSTIRSASMSEVIYSDTAPTDAVNTSSTIRSGVMARILITYDLDAEAVSTTATISTGNLE